jgi:hypothetical protein
MNSDYYLKVTPADLEKALGPNTYDLPHLYHPEPNRIWRTSVLLSILSTFSAQLTVRSFACHRLSICC